MSVFEKKTLLKSKKQWSCSKLTLNFMIKLQLLLIFLYFFCVIFQFFPPGSRSAYWMRNRIHSLPGLKFPLSLSGFSYSIIHPPNIHHSSTYHPMIPITHPQSYPSFIYRAIHYSPTARAIHNSLTEQYCMSLGLSYPSFIIWVLNDIAVHLSMINRSLSHRTTHHLATDLILHLPT